MFRKLKIFVFFWICGLIYADKVIILTDIHFNPYADCSKIPLYCSKLNDLIEKPVEQWSFSEVKPSQYEEETNYSLLSTALSSFKNQVESDDNVSIFLTGDMLAHGFNMRYKYYKLFSSQDDITAFSAKTLLFVIQQIHKTYSKSTIYFVLGNNDTDMGDYMLPSDEWLLSIANRLSKYIPESYQVQFTNQFMSGGFYSIPLNHQLQIIGINNNVFSHHTQDSRGMAVANFEINWLNAQLAKLTRAGKYAIILQHIPLGADAYSSINKSKPVMLLNEQLQLEYVNTLRKFNKNISAIYAGHLHSEYLENIESIPLIGTIALNRRNGNYVGAKLLDYSNNTGKLNKFTTYTFTDNQESTPQWSQLYSYPDSYNTTDSINNFIKSFPSDITNIQAKLYQRSYDGNSILHPQPIHNNIYWGYYFCFMNNTNEIEYSNCMKSFNHTPNPNDITKN
ncbi:MAG: hypothetical protein K2P99_05815 [Burkholderiales bacterium]|nr:hypothetical protein [Burkholderiales bacterium]